MVGINIPIPVPMAFHSFGGWKRSLFGLDSVEISDGSLQITHDLKCEYISLLAKQYTVLSEVGSKEAGILIHPKVWKSMMNNELQAGSWKVIAEARESGTVGIFRPSGKAHVSLVKQIVESVPAEDIIWSEFFYKPHLL